jgi:hypothetical protein
MAHTGIAATPFCRLLYPPPWGFAFQGLISMKNGSAIATVALSACAAAFGAGVGQLVGGAIGASVACAFAGMAIVLVAAPDVSALTAARAIAIMAASAGMGCVADEVPATHWRIDPELLGNTKALFNTLFALALRGAVQIGFPAALFAAFLTGRPRGGFGVLALVGILVALQYAGGWLIDSLPESPRSTLSRLIMASAPVAAGTNALQLWGGALAVVSGVFLWSKFVWNDGVCFRLGLWGLFSGAIALPLAHAFAGMVPGKADWLPAGALREAFGMVDPGMCTQMLFGCAWGGILGFGAWRNCDAFASTPDVGSLRLPWEVGLLAIHTTMVLAATFAPAAGENPLVRSYTQPGVIALAIPLMCASAGRRSPWLLVLPILMAPFIGFAVRHGVYETQRLSPDVGWTCIVAIPVAIIAACAAWASLLDEESVSTPASFPIAVVLSIETVLLLGLAGAILDSAWPWLATHRNTVPLSILMGLGILLGCVCGPIALKESFPSTSRTLPTSE